MFSRDTHFIIRKDILKGIESRSFADAWSEISRVEESKGVPKKVFEKGIVYQVKEGKKYDWMDNDKVEFFKEEKNCSGDPMYAFLGYIAGDLEVCYFYEDEIVGVHSEQFLKRD